jgi:hypothetical protein
VLLPQPPGAEKGQRGGGGQRARLGAGAPRARDDPASLRRAARAQIPVICGTACGALLTRPTPHFACNCRVCAAAPEPERLVFLSRNAFVTHLRDAGAFGNKKEGLLYVVQADGSSAGPRAEGVLPAPGHMSCTLWQRRIPACGEQRL